MLMKDRIENLKKENDELRELILELANMISFIGSALESGQEELLGDKFREVYSQLQKEYPAPSSKEVH